MHKYKLLFWSLLIGLMSACSQKEIIPQEKPVVETNPPTEAPILQGKMRIKFKPGHDYEQWIRTKADNRQFPIKSIRRVFREAGKYEARTRKAGLHLWYEVEFDSNIPVTRALSIMHDTSVISCAEPIYCMQYNKYSCEPLTSAEAETALKQTEKLPFNDPNLAKQWHYHNTGNSSSFVAGADINLFEAWKKNCGTRDVIVAIIDGGIDYNHEDLKGNVGNPAEINGIPGKDDDNNGYVDDCYGWNFTQGNNNITVHEHGTHVAGTVGAENNNGKGVCGVAGGKGNHSGVWLLSCQLLEEIYGLTDWGYFPDVIKYAADAGAVIAQNSWGYHSLGFLPQTDQDAIDYFVKYAGTDENGEQSGPMKGGVVIFAAGNENRGSDCYPGAYEKVVGVAAYRSDFKKGSYSNYGPWVDISAPGGFTANYKSEGVLSTLPNNQYGFLHGTSMAAPHVSGIAALIVSEFGGPGFTNEMLLQHLYKGTRNHYVYNKDYIGKLGIGAADAALALSERGNIPPDPIGEVTFGNTTGVLGVSWPLGTDADDMTPLHYLVCWSKDPLPEINPHEVPADVNSLCVRIEKNRQPGDTVFCQLKNIMGETTYYVSITAIDVWGNVSPNKLCTFTTPPNHAPVVTCLQPENYLTLKFHEYGEIAFHVKDPEGQDYKYKVRSQLRKIRHRQNGDTIFVSMQNKDLPFGEYTVKVEVTDIGSAMGIGTCQVKTLNNLPPQLIVPYEGIWMDSLYDKPKVNLLEHFDDEEKDLLTYTIHSDPEKVKITRDSNCFHVEPLVYGPSSIKIEAIDAEGLSSYTYVPIMCHNYKEEITLYPNPVVDYLYIRTRIQKEGEMKVRIYTLGGQEIFSRTIPYDPFKVVGLNLSDLKSGTYKVHVTLGKWKWNQNIIKA